MYQEELQNIEYFRNKSAHFIANVALVMKPLNVNKGDYVYLRGDPLDASK